jgi:pyruvate,water dikinase
MILAIFARQRSTPFIQFMIKGANPDTIMHWWALPVKGVGLTRLEFMISSIIKVHPMALLQPDKVKDPDVRKQIATPMAAYDSGAGYRRGLGGLSE